MSDPVPLNLVKPSLALQAAYEAMMKDWQSDLENITPFTLREEQPDFGQLVHRLQGYAKGENLNWDVPHHTYWALNQNQEIVGVVNIRPHLTERLLQGPGHIGYGVSPSHRRRGYATEILKQSLRLLYTMGTSKAMLSTSLDNEASAKTILANGGVFTRKGMHKGQPIKVYWINLESYG